MGATLTSEAHAVEAHEDVRLLGTQEAIGSIPIHGSRGWHPTIAAGWRSTRTDSAQGNVRPVEANQTLTPHAVGSIPPFCQPWRVSQTVRAVGRKPTRPCSTQGRASICGGRSAARTTACQVVKRGFESRSPWVAMRVRCYR